MDNMHAERAVDYYRRNFNSTQGVFTTVPYNLSDSISDVIIAYSDGTAVGCAGLKRGYVLIDNYPPYDKLEGAICMALNL